MQKTGSLLKRHSRHSGSCVTFIRVVDLLIPTAYVLPIPPVCRLASTARTFLHMSAAAHHSPIPHGTPSCDHHPMVSTRWPNPRPRRRCRPSRPLLQHRRLPPRYGGPQHAPKGGVVGVLIQQASNLLHMLGLRLHIEAASFLRRGLGQRGKQVRRARKKRLHRCFSLGGAH